MDEVVLYDPGLVGNDADGMSCMHACMKMVMKTKQGGMVFSFDEINTILRRKSGYYSWDFAISEAISRQGFKVRSITTFSAKRFVLEKEAYLLERYGQEAGQVQIKNTDMPIVLEDAQRYLESSNVEDIERIPTLDDVRTLLSEGWYLVPLVNSKILNAQSGYAGHFIFVYGFDDEGILFHDPGLPPQGSRKVSWKLFEEAWSSPKVETRSINCFRSAA